jgi:hypothetical protein
MCQKLKNSGSSSYDHRNSHDKIRDAIYKKYGVRLTDYLIDPINPDNIKQFLQNNATLHADMNVVLKLQSADLLDVKQTTHNRSPHGST